MYNKQINEQERKTQTQANLQECLRLTLNSQADGPNPLQLQSTVLQYSM
jgi:hypothetical protein